MALWDNNQLKLVMHLAAPLVDSSPNGYSMYKTAGTPTAVTGHAGGASGALNLANAQNYNPTSDVANLKITGNLTVSFWINPQSITNGSFYGLVTKWSNTGPAYGYRILLKGIATNVGVIQFDISGNGSTSTRALGTAHIPTGVWTPVTCIYDGTNIYVYVNGILDVSTAYSSGIYNNTILFCVGSQGDLLYQYPDYMDDIAVWNRALSATEVQTMAWMLDDFALGAAISGILKDKNGNAINCSTYPVRVNCYPKNNTSSAPVRSTLISAADGSWALGGLVASTKYIATFEYENVYPPTSDVDIAGAEFMTAA